ncbi:SRPBCC family protein [Prauserella rugosa]|uniref:Carbon monoxide dehydrogenase subunit G n=1 Tax=Prauserella rugosa TaxID=43354 RepID=A0A660C5H2_9PSEU|nr:SRPBCC family protein [Prauserella rugosa]KMS66382.1 carbon monoxide dehydrogenase [Streptomyces regensis]TWH18830.1 hypothetical protein JD82_00651 [Prauserella rugosa]
MILENHIDVPAAPDAVFALINDVERVATCLPGATLDGTDGDAYRGRVRFKVGPITAAYAGTVRFAEVAADTRSLRLSARGADTHGNGDAEADVTLVVDEGPQGATIRLRTDLSVRGRIAQFGKSAISAVSTRLLDQFARNLVAELSQPQSARDASASADDAAHRGAGAAAPSGTAGQQEALDGVAMLVPPAVRRYGPVAAAAAVAFVQGWLCGRLRAQRATIKELQHGHR